jgi:hypothetical protein
VIGIDDSYYDEFELKNARLFQAYYCCRYSLKVNQCMPNLLILCSSGYTCAHARAFSYTLRL